VQLINKTNQFNLNGRRFTDEEVGTMLATGGSLYTATLDDRTGSHGEILACLMDERGRVRSLVLSCRVFQRRVEHAFFVWLLRRIGATIELDFAATERNTPLREFLKDPAFSIAKGVVLLNASQFVGAHEGDLVLFALKEVAGAGA
jgi:FkbH-like protein